jgi:ketosteroid isomerase-like protein
MRRVRINRLIGKSEWQQASEKVRATRPNSKSGPWNIERIVVAPSGDMAYEYGTHQISFDDTKTGKHPDITSAYLRVWKVAGGTCKIAAIMYGREETR